MRRPQDYATTKARHEAITEKHQAGVPEFLIALARKGENPWCVDCGGESMGGGLRCYQCYRKLAEPELSRVPGASKCGTDYGYERHRKKGQVPCRRCKDAHAEATRDRAWRAA